MRVIYNAPCGELLIEIISGKLRMCRWIDRTILPNESVATDMSSVSMRNIDKVDDRRLLKDEDCLVAGKVIFQLDEYFSGTRQIFDLPLQIEGTPFRKKVWMALTEIPYGKVVSYSDLAKKCGYTGGQRAVAQACSANTIPIIIPCHRVVRSDGTLGGYTINHSVKRSLVAHPLKSPDSINSESSDKSINPQVSKGTTPQGVAIKQYLLTLEQSNRYVK